MALPELVHRLRPGDHVSWTVDDDADLARLCTEFVRAAIPQHHRVLLVTAATTPSATLAALRDAGVDTDGLVNSGQLVVSGWEEVYLIDGSFQPELMVERCADTVRRAHADGFAGLRMLGDANWTLAEPPGADGFARYETEVNRVFLDDDIAAVCVYDQRRFAGSRLAALQAAHPAGAEPGSDEDWCPMLRIRHLDDGPGLRLDGETDLSNREAVLVALDDLQGPASGRRTPTLDLTELRFMDIATAHQVLRTAIGLGGLRVVGASAQLTRLLGLVGADREPCLTIEPAPSAVPQPV
jgi:hypothetical protein